jgi:cytochrome c peroxidase
MYRTIVILSVLGVLLFVLSDCIQRNSPQDILAQSHIVHLKVPAYFPPLADTTVLTEEKITLGKKLFFDERLSGNNRISCATYHQPKHFFADTVALSEHGVSHQRLKRHTPTLLNVAWIQHGLFWDGGASNLASLVFAPLQHKDEMAQDLKSLVAELSADHVYKDLFQRAFGNDSITSANIARALAQYQMTLLSTDSRYDRWLQGKDTLTLIEQKGLKLFTKNCAVCHVPPLFTDNRFHNNGISNSFSPKHEGIEQGRARITLKKEDMGKFKTPTLRNIAHTAPYMHDGRFKNLDEVLLHYTNGIKQYPTLDGSLEHSIRLSPIDQEAIIAFLKTLTDEQLLLKSF